MRLHIPDARDVFRSIPNKKYNHFAQKGLSINEGIAIDASLIQSARRPIRNDQIKEFREKRDTPEGKPHKKGKALKFSRDLDSDRVMQNETPHYGLKEHASVNVNNGFILAAIMTTASYRDSPYLPYCTVRARMPRVAAVWGGEVSSEFEI